MRFLKGLALWLCSLILILIFFSCNSAAQQITATATYPKLVYDRAKVVTVHGTVMEVAVHRCSMGWKNSRNVTAASSTWDGVHILLDTPYGRIDAHLGPTWFLKKSRFQAMEGDLLDVTGSKFLVDGTFVLIVREVSKGNKTFFLRDVEGTPLWLDGVLSSKMSFAT